MKFMSVYTESARSGTRFKAWRYNRVSTVTTASARRKARISVRIKK